MEKYSSSHKIQEHLDKVVFSQSFLNCDGLGNEVPFFICPFNPKETLALEALVQRLVDQLHERSIPVLHIHLFDLVLDILKAWGIWEEIIQIEAHTDKAELRETLENVLDAKEHLIPEIRLRLQAQSPKVMFITGVGTVYPYIRSHTILNNLQSTAVGFPTVLFFPGLYEQAPHRTTALRLFGLLSSDRYYRAFNILDYHV